VIVRRMELLNYFLTGRIGLFLTGKRQTSAIAGL